MEDQKTVTVPLAPPIGPAPAPVVAVAAVPLWADPVFNVFLGSFIVEATALLEQTASQPVTWRGWAHVGLAALGAVFRYKQNTVVK